MNEAEIQSAVEAAAVIFKKVVLQRRQAAKKVPDEGEYRTHSIFSILIKKQNQRKKKKNINFINPL